jgi:hypothetical protein
MLSISATLSQNMAFIKDEHATAYLSSILDFHCSGFLQYTGWFVTNILGQQICSNFKGQDVQEERLFFLDVLISWTSCPEMSVTNQPTSCDDPEAQRSCIHHGRSLKSRIS